MQDLEGFLVLSIGPLAVLAILLAGVIAVWVAVSTQSTRSRKWVAASLSLVIVLLIPTWDVIAGRLYFRYLCATDAGMRIYKQVDLGPERRNIQAFPDIPLQYNRLPISKQYPYRPRSIPELPGPARIKLTQESIVDGKSGEVLGEIVEYHYGGGWFQNSTSLGPVSSTRCAPGGQSFKSLLDQIFPSSS